MTVSHGPYATIDRFLDSTEAQIVAGRLQTEGIPVLLLGANHASIDWPLLTALGGVELQGPAALADAPRRILAEKPLALDGVDDTCPKCGGPRTLSASAPPKLSFFLLHFVSLPLPWRPSACQCEDCGHRWSEASDE